MATLAANADRRPSRIVACLISVLPRGPDRRFEDILRARRQRWIAMGAKLVERSARRSPACAARSATGL